MGRPMPTHIVAVGGIVQDHEGQILLVKSRYGWVYPGGQVEVGENLIDALVREVKEESGILVTVSHLVGVYSNTGSYTWHDGVTHVPTKVMLDFACVAVGGELCTSDETSESRWVPQEKVLDLITATPYRLRYQAFLEFKGQVQYLEYITRPEFEVKVRQQV